MKKIGMVLLSAVLFLTMTACGTKQEPKDDESVQQEEVVNTTTAKEEPQEMEVSIDTLKSMSETDPTDFEYRDVDDGIEITAYLGEDVLIAIPEKIDGKTVVAVGDSAFVNEENIKGVRIADSITTIKESAFLNCFSLKVLICGASLKAIESHAFSNCKELTDVVLNNGIEKLNMCFCITGISRIEIPASVNEMFAPFTEKVTIVGEPGSYVEEYVKENGEAWSLTFEAKE